MRPLYLSLFSFCGIAIGIFAFVLGGKFLVLFSDFVEFLHVLKEVLASLQGNEQFGFLAVTPASLNSDGSGSNLLEYGIVVSIIHNLRRNVFSISNLISSCSERISRANEVKSAFEKSGRNS